MSNRSLLMSALVAGAAFVTTAPLLIAAQKPITQGAEITETVTIEAIDSTARLVTLKNAAGLMDTVYCGPDVKRFDELKVGDKVTLKYYESLIFAIQKPGETPPAPENTSITRTAGARPGGTIAKQMTTAVTVLAIDPDVPSVTIQTEDGRKMSFKIDEKKNLEGVKVGDKVQITYTQALAISITPGT